MLATGSSLGDYLHEQRRQAQLSLRQLAEQTGVSNPYLRQIERRLRKPSAEVLHQIAKAVELAVLADSGLTERQKSALLDIYASFRRESDGASVQPEEGDVA